MAVHVHPGLFRVSQSRGRGWRAYVHEQMSRDLGLTRVQLISELFGYALHRGFGSVVGGIATTENKPNIVLISRLSIGRPVAERSDVM